MERTDLERWKPREVARLLALVETERRYYQEIVAHLPVGLVIVSSELWLQSANRFFRQIFSLKAEEVSRRRLNEVLRVDDLNDGIAEVIATGSAQHNILYSPPGEASPRFFRVSILPVRNWEDEMELEALVVFEDLTGIEQAAIPRAAKKAAAKPEEAQPVLVPQPVEPPQAGKLLENFDALVWECDPGLELTDISPYAEELLGYPVKQLLADHSLWEQRIHPDDRQFVFDQYADAVANRNRIHLEYCCRTAAGKTIWVRESARIQRDREGNPVKICGVTIDITENRHLTERVVLWHKMDSLQRLASRAAHEYNNFLMVISGYGEDLLRLLPAENPLRPDVEQIVSASEKVHDLTGKLLSFSRRPMPKPEVFDFGQLVGDVLHSYTPERLGRVEMVRVLDPEVGSVEADRLQLEKALSMLLEAALRGANQSGTLAVETTREAPMAISDDTSAVSKITLSIAASGWEMEVESRRRLFEPAIMGQQAGTPLSDAYWFVRQNRGDISVFGDAGQGTTILISLPAVSVRRAQPLREVSGRGREPLVPAAAEPGPVILPQPVVMPALAPEAAPAPAPLPVPEPVAPPERKPAAAAGAGTVLVVEDEEGIRTLMRKILVRNGYEVLEAETGTDAVRLAHEYFGSIRLLVTDMVMPEMSGRELADQLRSFLPDLRVVFASGYTDDAAIHSGALPPGTAFLQKPFTLGSLLDKVKEVLEADK